MCPHKPLATLELIRLSCLSQSYSQIGTPLAENSKKLSKGKRFLLAVISLPGIGLLALSIITFDFDFFSLVFSSASFLLFFIALSGRDIFAAAEPHD